MPPPRKVARPGRAGVAIEIALAISAVILCCVDIRWEIQAGLFPILDEVSTRAIVFFTPYRQLLNFIPVNFYADRPMGWAFIKLMSDGFGFDYPKQAACLAAVHFANCGLAFWLYRRLGVTIPVAIAGVGFFGSLWTSAQTSTYIGEAFDVVCLFFLLGSAIAVLSEKRGASILSALLFLAALRSKEFAIVTPFLLTVLLMLWLPRFDLREIARRLWLHYFILIAFGLRYAYLYRIFRTVLTPGNPYRMDLHVGTVLTSLSYYTALIFGKEDHLIPPVLLGVILASILGWAVWRRRAGVAFGIVGYVLTALPVSLMPNIRAPYWAYAPQVFLILALCLIVQEIFVNPWKRAEMRWVAAVCVAIACLGWCVWFRRTAYFNDRVSWTLNVRRVSMRTALDATAQFPKLGAGTHVYISRGPEVMPWLFLAGPCSYLQIVNGEKSITCIWDQPADQIRAEYEQDSGPKYFVDYHEDGSIAVKAR